MKWWSEVNWRDGLKLTWWTEVSWRDEVIKWHDEVKWDGERVGCFEVLFCPVLSLVCRSSPSSSLPPSIISTSLIFPNAFPPAPLPFLQDLSLTHPSSFSILYLLLCTLSCPSVCLSILSVCLFISLFVSLFLFVCVSVCLFVSLSLSLS